MKTKTSYEQFKADMGKLGRNAWGLVKTIGAILGVAALVAGAMVICWLTAGALHQQAHKDDADPRSPAMWGNSGNVWTNCAASNATWTIYYSK